MPIRKKGDVEIQASANGTKVKQTGYTFYSYDKNAAALYFQFREQDGQPTDLGKATVHLVMILNDDNGKKFIPGDDEIEVISAIRGTAKYVLPDNLLGYEGKVTSYVYLDFSDGSHTDEGHFAFEIKRSLITDVIPEAGDKYVKDFEDIKAEVQEAADGAKETISQKVTEVSDTSDSAISKVNQVADDTIKTADQAKSDVQSKADEASDSIDEAVKSTESARDEAIETMTDLDYSNRNLLTGTSSEWEEFSFDGWVAGYMGYSLEQLGLKVGDTLTYAAELDNTRDESNLSSLRVSVNFFGKEDEVIDRIYGNKINSNEKGISIGKGEIPEGTTRIIAYKLRKTEGNESKKAAARKHKLQKGNYATYWTPNPSEIVTQDQYDKLVNAITNLGGSI
ncbi:phage baseplate upper protein [Tetragenococcus halophilus]|uniref:phage baseplate upper protein n=1 Tax=Tetragenococcus halophilus TaxID=51669 RepID=UPI00209AF463|nr:phage baseplate upper protein [Tetragenococcus halophilus]MCO8294515.1 phage baseplate upper protein [Tetragenococcus halophilus]